ncbi:MAG TPA: hypothetical protein VFO89_00105, partial [Thermoanaerobaculia bacterium]|nr:hypothetical protein [Thermoanaerobaculia bacterium]
VALAHYLDVETGDILDVPLDAEPPGDPARFRRIPTRTAESERDDRERFVAALAPGEMRDALARSVADHGEFRRALLADRKTERSFFNFKNDRASAAIEEWLREEGLDG